MKRLLFLCALLMVSVSANAFILHWADYASIAPGTTSYTYTNVDGSGIDITVDWIQSSNLASGYPTNDIGTLGMGSGHWFVNAVPGSTVVLVSFSQPVPYCQFNIWEIDGIMEGEASLTNYIDRVRLKGWNQPYDVTGGTYIVPSSYDGGEDIVIIDDGINGINFINGGMYNEFDANPANVATATFTDPTFQAFAFQYYTSLDSRGSVLGDISFVPEPATLALLGLGGLLGLKRRGR